MNLKIKGFLPHRLDWCEENGPDARNHCSFIYLNTTSIYTTQYMRKANKAWLNYYQLKLPLSGYKGYSSFTRAALNLSPLHLMQLLCYFLERFFQLHRLWDNHRFKHNLFVWTTTSFHTTTTLKCRKAAFYCFQSSVSFLFQIYCSKTIALGHIKQSEKDRLFLALTDLVWLLFVKCSGNSR